MHTVDLVFGARSVTGSLTGSSIGNEDNLTFSVARGIRPIIEVLPLSEGRRPTSG